MYRDKKPKENIHRAVIVHSPPLGYAIRMAKQRRLATIMQPDHADDGY